MITDGSDATFNASLRTPADEISTTVTPFPSDTEEPTPEETVKALKAVAAGLLPTEEPDGKILNTVSVSQLCFKVGRITVPPAVVLATQGFSMPAFSANGLVTTEFSQTNPPPHWGKAKAIMSKPMGGSSQKLNAFYKGGWRDMPEGERWWEQALGGVIEDQRKTNLLALDALRKGMDGARNV